MLFNPLEIKQKTMNLNEISKKVVFPEQSDDLTIRHSYNDQEMQKSVNDVIKVWKKDLDRKFDVLTLITGQRGAGKSTFAVHLAESLKKEFNFNYDFPKNYFYFLKAINDPNIKVIIVDEAIAELNLRRSMSDVAVKYLKLITLCRSKMKIGIFLIPKIRLLDVFMRGDYVYQWFEIRQRNDVTREGTCLWFVKNMNDFVSTDAFDFRAITQAIKETSLFPISSELTEIRLREKLYKYCINYVGHVKYIVSEDELKITEKYSEAIKQEKIKNEYTDAILDEYEYVLNHIQKKFSSVTFLRKISRYPSKMKSIFTEKEIEAIYYLNTIAQSNLFNPQLEALMQFAEENGIDLKKKKDIPFEDGYTRLSDHNDE